MDLGDRNEKMGNRGQIFANPRANSGTICRKFAPRAGKGGRDIFEVVLFIA